MDQKENPTPTAFVGLDLGKKTIVGARVDHNGKVLKRFTVSIPTPDLSALLQYIEPGDRIVMESGNQSFRIAQYFLDQGYSQTYVLNAGDLHVIYASMKKTDKEDSLKLARLICHLPISQLPVVSLPSDWELTGRRLVTEYRFWRKQHTQLVNALHGLFTSVGITYLKRSDLKSSRTRAAKVTSLTGSVSITGKRYHEQLIHIEKNLKDMEGDIQAHLREQPGLVKISMSIPGIGLIGCLVLLSYLGDMSRFSHGDQVSHYAGLVPRVNCSGQQNHYGGITKRGNSHLRGILIQCAWVLVGSKDGGSLRTTYKELSIRKGKGRAIVAVARKMLVVLYQMMRTGELYRDIDEKNLEKKLKRYKIL